MKILVVALSVLLLAFATRSARAQTPGTSAPGTPGIQVEELQLDKWGGAVPGTGTLMLRGTPYRTYWTLFCNYEERTEVVPGLYLEIPWEYVNLSLEFSGMVGALGSAGLAMSEFEIPDDPALLGEVVSLQALYTDSFDVVSNLVRLTPQRPGTFAPALESPDVPLFSGLAAPRPDGSLLLIGAQVPLVHRYDPDLEEFEVLDLGVALGSLSTHTVLPDGRILMTGGLDLGTGQPTDRCLLHDPGSGDVTELFMNQPRAGHAAALSGRGEVVISGGFREFDLTDLLALFAGIQNSVEVFEPDSLSFRSSGEMLEAKALHSATSTETGDVLATGGLTLIPILEIPFVSNTAYLYDSGSDRFSVVPIFMSAGRILHGAGLLDDGRILHAGGINIDFEEFLRTGDPLDLAVVALDSADLWKDGFLGGTFEEIEGMVTGRALPAVVALEGTRALVAGGFHVRISGDPSEWEFELHRSADIYEAKAFTETGPLVEARLDPIATLLDDGTVLVVGGGGLSAEIYQD